MTSQNLLIRKFQVARLPTSSGLAGSLLADSEEIGQRKRCWEKSYCYFYLSAGHGFLGERGWRKYDVLSLGGQREGGGGEVGTGGRRANEKRRIVVRAPIVFPTHGPHQTDAQTCADSDAFCATACRGRLTQN
jgi:hypothetical protein